MWSLAMAAGTVAVLPWVVSLVLGRRARLRRKLQRLPLTPIVQVKTGEQSKVEGHVRPASSVLRGPLTDTPCVFYRLNVERLDGAQGTISPLFVTESGVDFDLRDTTGVIAVRLSGAWLDISQVSRVLEGWWSDLPRNLADLVDKQMAHTDGWHRRCPLRITEQSIPVDGSLQIYGIARVEPADSSPRESHGYRGMATRLVLTGTRSLPVVISDYHLGNRSRAG